MPASIFHQWRTFMRLFAVILVALAVAACGGSQKQENARNDQTEATHEGHDQAATSGEASGEMAGEMEVVAVAAGTRTVRCGCAIESIGACGDYIEIDGKYAFVANWEDLGLGPMEWCGQEGVTAESSGELRDGKFYATTLVVNTAD